MARDASAGRGLFDRLGAEGWSVVEQWVKDHEPETNHLEFKNKHDPKSVELDDEDRDELARSLSAFANTGGGLLVFGVDAGGGDKKGRTFDRVRSIRAIADAEAFGGLLERRVKGFTDPPIAALAVLRVSEPASKAGIVAVYVPVSDGGPHRAVGGSSEVNDRYYMRTAAGAQTMPHPLLADRFGRAARPRLSAVFRLVTLQPIWVSLSLVNRGRGSAVRPALLLGERPPPSLFGWPVDDHDPDDTGFLGRHAAGDAILYEPHRDVVIYPGIEKKVVDVRTRVYGQPGLAMRFAVTLFALDAQPIEADGELLSGTGDRILELPIHEEA